MAALAGTEALKRLTDMSLGACVQLGVVVCTKWISVTLIQKSPCHEDVLLLRRGVNVFTDLQSTCDFVFWYLFYLNAPIKNMSYDLCTPQAFLGFKTFSVLKLPMLAQSHVRWVLRRPSPHYSGGLMVNLL